MFGRSTKTHTTQAGTPPIPKGTSPSVIAADMNVLGNIMSDGVLDIDGQIDGNVRCHTANIRSNGRIRGDVMAEVINVHGTVEGLIKAPVVMLHATARVTGTIMHESLTIEDGAFLDGKCKRTDKLLLEDLRDKPAASRPSPSLDSSFDNDNDEPPSAAEIKILENLRLIS